MKGYIKPIVGIYRIWNKFSGRSYIGQSVNIFRRWAQHSNMVYGKKQEITKAIAKYGIDNFSFEVLEVCLAEDLNRLEKFYIEKFNSLHPNGYNMTAGGSKLTKRKYVKSKVKVDKKSVSIEVTSNEE